MDAKAKQTKIDGCLIVQPKVNHDTRGWFIKSYHKGFYTEIENKLNLEEEFFSYSKKNVLRGLHFQSPPYEHSKHVTCLIGKVLDVFIDLRRSSATFGVVDNVVLEADKMNILVLPKGVAHGFLTLSEYALLQYKTDKIYNPSVDSGILWSSIPFSWPINDPILSDRDKQLPPFTKNIRIFE